MSLFCWTQRRYSEECGNRAVLGHHWCSSIFFLLWESISNISLLIIPCMIVYVTNNKEPLNPWTQWCPKQPDYKLSSEYVPLCSAEQRHSYRFGTNWEWVDDDRIVIFGWTIPLLNKSGTVFSEFVIWALFVGRSFRINQCFMLEPKYRIKKDDYI